MLDPFTVTVYVPTAPLQESCDVCGDVPSVTLDGVSKQVNPVLGKIVSVRATVPVNPVLVETEIVSVPAWPWMTLTAGEAAVTVNVAGVTKSRVAVAECVRDPLLPVTVRL